MRGAVLSIMGLVMIAGCAPDRGHLFGPPSPDQECIPGSRRECTCPDGVKSGTQVCLPDAAGFGACEGCEDEAAESSASSAPGTSGSAGGGGGGAGGGDGGAGTGGAGSGEGGGGPECVAPQDCPGTDTACAQRTCEAGACGWRFTSAVSVINQIPGDCLEHRCDGAGNEFTVPAPSDVPNDGNECTFDACMPSGPTHTPVPAGTRCSTGLCHEGACVQHLSVRCQTLAGTFVDCDGGSHDYAVRWGTSLATVVGCDAYPNGAAYCAPGSTCYVFRDDGSYTGGTCM